MVEEQEETPTTGIATVTVGAADDKLAMFAKAIKSNGAFDLRKAAGGKWHKALKQQDGLAEAYTAVGRGYTQQQAFRSRWVLDSYENLRNEKMKEETNSQSDFQNGVYVPFTILWEKQGKDSSGLQAARRYAVSCWEKTTNGEEAAPGLCYRGPYTRKDWKILKNNGKHVFGNLGRSQKIIPNTCVAFSGTALAPTISTENSHIYF